MADIRFLFRCLSVRQRRQFLALILALVVAAFAEMIKIGAVLPLIALAASQGSSAPGIFARVHEIVPGDQPIVVAAGFLIGAAVFAVGSRLTLLWLTHRFVVGFGQEISREIFSRILRQPYEHYKLRSSSEILAGFDKVRTVIFYVFLPALQALTSLIVAMAIIVLLVRVDWFVASLASVSMCSIFLAAHFLVRQRLHGNSKAIASAATVKTAIVQEALGNIRDILIDDTQEVFERHFRDVDARLRSAQSVNMLTAAGPGALIESAAIITLVAAVLIASGRPGGIVAALPALGALALGAQRLLPLLQQVYAGWAQVAGNARSVTDVIELLQLPVSSSTGLTARRSDPMLREAVVFEDVSFAFHGKSATLEGIDLRIPRGSFVGVVGESGSGKSTLADLLMGLLRPTSGSILIDSVLLNEETRRQWQHRVSHVPQSVYLSNASISSNIAFGVPEDEVDHDRVAAVAQIAQVSRFLKKMPDGYATCVGEGGARLSGGERQRLGIARALYKQSDILILDEATSALAEDMEDIILRSLRDLDKTLVMVTHRRASLLACDFIVEISDGRARVVGGRDDKAPRDSQRSHRA